MILKFSSFKFLEDAVIEIPKVGLVFNPLNLNTKRIDMIDETFNAAYSSYKNTIYKCFGIENS